MRGGFNHHLAGPSDMIFDMSTNQRGPGRAGLALVFSFTALASSLADDSPPNPFGAQPLERTDAIFGAVCLSDGTIVRGKVYLTRALSLRIYDAAKEENRDVPLKAIREIRCFVEKEWLEAEWRFKENANDEKVQTGRKYPSRIYVHEIVLVKGGSIKGPLSAVVYVEPEAAKIQSDRETPEKETNASQDAESTRAHKPVRYLLHKRDKGEPGTTLRSLVYVEKIVLGDEARKLSQPRGTKDKREPAPDKG
jgi:hypothetical protein